MTTPANDAADQEIYLTRDRFQLHVSPYGASLRGLHFQQENGEWTEVIAGYSGASHKVGGQGDVLIPFPGRVRQGRYTFEGQEHQMKCNDKEAPNAIHGFVRTVPWETKAQSEHEITFATSFTADQHAGYPFALEIQVTYRVETDGLTTRFAIKNVGDKTAPVSAGFHPYFKVGRGLIDADQLHAPFESYLEYDSDLAPTGRVLPVKNTPLDFLQPHAIGQTSFNTCYLNPRPDEDQRIRVRLSCAETGRAVTVWLDGDPFRYAVLYSGDPLPEEHRRRALAIEPMTIGSDAFNHPEWGLVALPPNGVFQGEWGVSASL